jgi:hypothetical protein
VREEEGWLKEWRGWGREVALVGINGYEVDVMGSEGEKGWSWIVRKKMLVGVVG